MIQNLDTFLSYTPQQNLRKKIKPNTRIKMDGIQFLRMFKNDCISTCFFDPQYRGILDKMKYGNEGVKRGTSRSTLNQMTALDIQNFAQEINRVLKPSGHLFLWVDKFHLCTGTDPWFQNTNFEKVDLITWDKGKIGMGYRTRRRSEHLLVFQKQPKKAKGFWKSHNIPDVWLEAIKDKIHTHQKPVKLQAELIKSVTKKGDIIIDPASGSFSVLEACKITDRVFLGCDLKG